MDIRAFFGKPASKKQPDTNTSVKSLLQSSEYIELDEVKKSKEITGPSKRKETTGENPTSEASTHCLSFYDASILFICLFSN